MQQVQNNADKQERHKDGDVHNAGVQEQRRDKISSSRRLNSSADGQDAAEEQEQIPRSHAFEFFPRANVHAGNEHEDHAEKSHGSGIENGKPVSKNPEDGKAYDQHEALVIMSGEFTRFELVFHQLVDLLLSNLLRRERLDKAKPRDDDAYRKHGNAVRHPLQEVDLLADSRSEQTRAEYIERMADGSREAAE